MFDWQTGVVDYGALQRDAGFAFVVDRNGEREIGLISISRPCWGGEVLFDMPKSQHMYQGPVDYEVSDRKDRMPRWRRCARSFRPAGSSKNRVPNHTLGYGP